MSQSSSTRAILARIVYSGFLHSVSSCVLLSVVLIFYLSFGFHTLLSLKLSSGKRIGMITAVREPIRGEDLLNCFTYLCGKNCLV